MTDGTVTNADLLVALNHIIGLLEAGPSGSTAAAQIMLSLVPMLGIVFGATLVFFFLFWNYRLKRELIRTNQYTHTTVRTLRMFSLLIGLLSIAVGLPLTFLFLAVEGISYALLGGLIPMFTGIGLLVFYGASRTKE